MTWSASTPAQLLGAARTAAARPAEWGACWPRAAAILTRQALEDAVDAVWEQHAPGMVGRSWADKLTCLPWYIDADLARRTRHTWHALSNACHAHPYELAPTLGEVSGWISEVHALTSSAVGPTGSVPLDNGGEHAD